MATVFWDAFSIILVNNHDKYKTTNEEYFGNLLDRFNNFVKEKWSAFDEEKKNLFHQDNAMHVCTPVSSSKFYEFGY